MKNIAFLILFTFSTILKAQPTNKPLNLDLPPNTRGNGSVTTTTNGSGGGTTTFNGSNGSDYSEEAVKRRKVKCIEFMKQSMNKLADEKEFSRYCSDDGLARVVTDASWSINSAEYLQCANTAHAAGISADDFVFDCSYPSKNNSIRNPKFSECQKDLTPDFGKLPTYKACADSFFLSDYNKQEFRICADNMKYLKQTPDRTLSKCSNFSDRNRIISQRFVICLKAVEVANVSPGSIFDFCNVESNIDAITARTYNTCLKAMETAGVKTKLNQFGICANQDAQEIISRNPSTHKCYVDSLFSTYRNYFFYAAVMNANSNSSSDRTLYNFLNKDCKGESKFQTYPANPYLNLVREINIHTYEGMYLNKDWVQTGGYSALNYDPQTETLYMLSDETFMATKLPPRMYTYQLTSDLDLKDKGVFTFTFNPEKGDQEPDIDPEGLVRLSNGHFIVSSEIGANEVKKFETKRMQITNLNIFDAKGNYINSINLPENYKQKWTRSRIENNGGGGGFFSSNADKSVIQVADRIRGNGGFGGSNGGSNGFFPAPPPPPPTYVVELTGGLEFNKSLESLSVSPDEKFLFVANENALIQDRQVRGRCKSDKKKDGEKDENSGGINTGVTTYLGNGVSRTVIVPAPGSGSGSGGFYSSGPTCGKIVRIVKFNRDESGKIPYKYASEYKYELDYDIQDGLSEILAISANKLLTLERSWDSVKQKVTARLYKVELKDESIIPVDMKGVSAIEKIPGLEKTLIMDFDTLVSKLSPGFHNIDNLEGLAFGPVLKNGKRSLLMVTDNNFSTKQRTVFLVFEAQDSLFE